MEREGSNNNSGVGVGSSRSAAAILERRKRRKMGKIASAFGLTLVNIRSSDGRRIPRVSLDLGDDFRPK
ncbi:hypothetical protein H5410_050589 [Solanum commersonii]|uniref:Uncharacterized protein n=1 Tax=Solanum commersonii TaxID=4109 RepID=A0A9J5WVZ2_SOLCO|nr:hypothetical protein H5410_050589 [Solanum commersonii]